MNEPAKAEIRGSNPVAFPKGRDRKITATAMSNRNEIDDNRIATCIM
jgi:hypothetical protein